jgi:hypothetical protein
MLVQCILSWKVINDIHGIYLDVYYFLCVNIHMCGSTWNDKHDFKNVFLYFLEKPSIWGLTLAKEPSMIRVKARKCIDLKISTMYFYGKPL